MKQAKLIIYISPAGLFQRMAEQENASLTGVRLLEKISENVASFIPVVSKAPEGTYGRVTFVAGRQQGRRQTSADYEVSKCASAAQARDVKKFFDGIVKVCQEEDEKRKQKLREKRSKEELSCEILPEIQPPSDAEMQQLSS